MERGRYQRAFRDVEAAPIRTHPLACPTTSLGLAALSALGRACRVCSTMVFAEARIALRLAWVRLGLQGRVERAELATLLEALTPRARVRPLARWRVERGLRWGERFLHRLPRAALANTCLYRSLGRYAVYRGSGLPVRLVVGAYPGADGELVGHAWLELEGLPVGEAVDPRYRVTFSHPPPPPPAAGTPPHAAP
jgi:hypothetical protein